MTVIATHTSEAGSCHTASPQMSLELRPVVAVKGEKFWLMGKVHSIGEATCTLECEGQLREVPKADIRELFVGKESLPQGTRVLSLWFEDNHYLAQFYEAELVKSYEANAGTFVVEVSFRGDRR